MTKTELQAEVNRLSDLLSRESRALQCAYEWFTCEQRGRATTSLDVEIDGVPTLRVTVHGISRASGGVAVVHQLGTDWSDYPRYLDDLCLEWSHDRIAEIREAARLLLARREEYCRVAS